MYVGPAVMQALHALQRATKDFPEIIWSFNKIPLPLQTLTKYTLKSMHYGKSEQEKKD
jgi:hypothetical protein